MSNQQFTNFRLFKSFLRQLANFGLNRHDWKIDRASLTSEQIAEIRVLHREDLEFQFEGQLARTTAGKIYLQQLRLISL